MRFGRLGVTAMAVALGVGVAACGGDSSNADTAETVRIVEFAFAPKEISVRRGETVRWVNDDAFLHTVTSGDVTGPENRADGRFDESLAEKASEATVTFDEAGTYTYFCKQHNAMDGRITVR